MTDQPKCVVVDDSDSMLKLMSMFMEHLGFDPVTARDGDEGLAAVRKHHPVLVVSDIHMPNRNGLLLLQDIKELNPMVPVMLVTGYLSYKTDLSAMKNPPDAFMEKPFTFDEFKAAVEKIAPADKTVWTVH
jgi:DNA-binding NtrC family response regulator